jgi:Flp pilus assembly protein TadB
VVLWIEAIVKIIAYNLLFLGIWRLTYPLWIDSFRLQKRRRSLRKLNQSYSSNQNKKKRSRIHKHIRYLVLSLAKDSNEQRVVNFYASSISLFVLTFTMLMLLLKTFVLPMFVAIWVASLPYIWLRFRLANMRIEASLAFMKEFHIFFQIYQQYKDVYHTVMQTVKDTKDKRLQMAYRRLLSTMQKERTEEAFMEAAQLFSYSVGTSFSARFANLLVKAYREQVDISEALLDLYKDIQKREKDIAALTTKRMETVILGFMPIIFLMIFVWISFRIFMMYSTQFILNHINLAGFVIALILAIASALSAYLFRKPRADIY